MSSLNARQHPVIARAPSGRLLGFRFWAELPQTHERARIFFAAHHDSHSPIAAPSLATYTRRTLCVLRGWPNDPRGQGREALVYNEELKMHSASRPPAGLIAASFRPAVGEISTDMLGTRRIHVYLLTHCRADVYDSLINQLQ
jgi:hypothetical protein